eukprot:5038058-Prymnesium_polylepis.1
MVKRTSQKRKILEIGEGDEATDANAKERLATRSTEVNGMFTAGAYHWLFYGKAGVGLQEGVPFGQKCASGQCHKILNPSLEGDAGEVKGSDSMYAFAGINSNGDEGELYTMCYPCHCVACRAQGSPNDEFVGCPNRDQVGVWQRRTCQRSFGAVQRATTQNNLATT